MNSILNCAACCEISLLHLLSLGWEGRQGEGGRCEVLALRGWLHMGGAYLAIVIMISRSWVSPRVGSCRIVSLQFGWVRFSQLSTESWCGALSRIITLSRLVEPQPQQPLGSIAAQHLARSSRAYKAASTSKLQFQFRSGVAPLLLQWMPGALHTLQGLHAIAIGCVCVCEGASVCVHDSTPSFIWAWTS